MTFAFTVPSTYPVFPGTLLALDRIRYEVFTITERDGLKLCSAQARQRAGRTTRRMKPFFWDDLEEAPRAEQWVYRLFGTVVTLCVLGVVCGLVFDLISAITH